MIISVDVPTVATVFDQLLQACIAQNFDDDRLDRRAIPSTRPQIAIKASSLTQALISSAFSRIRSWT